MDQDNHRPCLHLCLWKMSVEWNFGTIGSKLWSGTLIIFNNGVSGNREHRRWRDVAISSVLILFIVVLVLVLLILCVCCLASCANIGSKTAVQLSYYDLQNYAVDHVVLALAPVPVH